MHIPDGILAPPAIAVTMLAGGAGFVYVLHRIRADLGSRATVRMGSMAAFVFAAQMVNFPIPFAGFSGHLMGGALAAALLGPWGGAGVIALVLLAQCLLFGDGGVTAWGANFLNMGLIGSVVGYGIYAPLRRRIGGPSGIMIGAMAAAWFSTILASGAFAVQMAASGRLQDFMRVLSWMVMAHALIGVGEALITGLTLRFLLRTRPDFIEPVEFAKRKPSDVSAEESEFAKPSGSASWRGGLAIFASALAIAIFLAPWAATSPDGLEWVSAKLGIAADSETAPLGALMPDYQAPGFASATALATAAAGATGTIVVFAAGWILAKGLAAKAAVAVPLSNESSWNPDAA